MGQRSTPFVQIRTVMNWKLLENALKSPLQVRAQSFEEVKMWVGWVIKNDRKCSKTGCSMWDESPRSLFFLFSYSKIQPNEIVNLWNIPKVGDWTAVCRSKTQKKRWKSFPPKSKLLKSSCAKPTQAVANKYLVWYAIMLIIYQKNTMLPSTLWGSGALGYEGWDIETFLCWILGCWIQRIWSWRFYTKAYQNIKQKIQNIDQLSWWQIHVH